MKNLRGLKVLVSTSTFAEADKAPFKRLKATGLKVITNPFRRKLTKGELLKLFGKDVVGLIAGLETIDREVLEKSHLKVISRCGAGLDNVDLKAAKDLNIRVYSTPDAPVTAVAELTVAAMLSLLRNIPRMDRDMHNSKWVKRPGVQLNGKTVAIIGFGRIGQRVAGILKACGARLLAVDPAFSGIVSGVSIVKLEKALKEADIITLHSSGSYRLLGAREFGLMKREVFLLNAARGKLIDEKALVSALDSGRVAGAWLDVFKEEPYRGPLCQYEQVILTPHVGSYSKECRLRMEIEAAENLIAGLRETKTQEAIKCA